MAPPREELVREPRTVALPAGRVQPQPHGAPTTRARPGEACEERRFDPRDLSGPWTKAEFEARYEGAAEWEEAAPDAEGFVVRHGVKVTLHGKAKKAAFEMPADDLLACKRECRERNFGAFTVRRGIAYFWSNAPEECVQKLQASGKSTTYLDVEMEVELQEAGRWAGQQKDLVDLEWKAEGEQITQRLTEWPLARLTEEGLTIVGLRAERVGDYFGEICMRFAPSAGGLLPQHEYQRGNEVLISQGAPLKDGIRAQVVFVGPGAVHCVLGQPLPRGLEWRLDRGPNRITYERTVAAIERFRGQDCRAREVRRVLLDCPGSAGNTTPEPLHLETEALRLLNGPQQEALRSVQGTRVGLIQGPPGCGKTFTACSLLKAACRETRPILAVADSHVALDQLLSGLLALGVRAVRVGAVASVTQEALCRVGSCPDRWGTTRRAAARRR